MGKDAGFLVERDAGIVDCNAGRHRAVAVDHRLAVQGTNDRSLADAAMSDEDRPHTVERLSRLP